jgi:hypothetical protein
MTIECKEIHVVPGWQCFLCITRVPRLSDRNARHAYLLLRLRSKEVSA